MTKELEYITDFDTSIYKYAGTTAVREYHIYEDSVVKEKVLASGGNDHSESGEINQFQPLENSQCTSATPFLS